MESKSTFSTNELDKRIRKQSIIIAILIIVILSLIVYVLLNSGKFIPTAKIDDVKFIEEVPEGVAIKGIENFEKEIKYTSNISDCKGVLYSPDEIQQYLTTKFPAILARHATATSAGSIPAGYKWKIAFCWTVRKNAEGKNRLAFYTVPMLTNGTEVLDYFSTSNNKYYKHPETDGAPGNIHDEGQLWP